MACFYRNQRVSIIRRNGDVTVTSIYDNASTVTIEEYRGASFLMIQYMDGNKLCVVRYNCADIVSFVLTATQKKSIESESADKDEENEDNYT